MYQTYHVCTTKYKSHPGRSVKSLQQEMFILEFFLGLLTKRLSIIFQAMRLITKKASFLFFVGIDSRDYFLKGSYEASCVLLGSLYGCISILSSLSIISLSQALVFLPTSKNNLFTFVCVLCVLSLPSSLQTI